MPAKMVFFRGLCAILGSSLVLLSLGCSRDVQLGDPALRPFQGMFAINRDQYGMAPLPSKAAVHIERLGGADARSHGYNVALHIYGKEFKHLFFFSEGKDFHHVFFRLANGEYKWVNRSNAGGRESSTL